DCAAVNVSVGAVPDGGVAAAKSCAHASGTTRAAQPASASASVAKLAIVGVCALLSESWITAPQPPVARSTRLGTLPAAILKPSAGPRSALPSKNCALVHTDATVVSSFSVTFAGGFAPSTARSASAALSPLVLSADERPPRATRYRNWSLPG